VPLPGEGGLFDANSYLGEWPSRRVNGERALAGRELVEQRLALMDRRGIQVAAVSSLEAVLLKDVSSANGTLHELIGDSDRFLPVYTLNPVFPGWREQLARCMEGYGLAAGRGGLRLHPSYHGYRLDAPALDTFLDAVAPLGVPLLLPVQIEDARLHQPAMQVSDVAPADVAALLNRRPDLPWIVTAAVYAEVTAIAKLLRPETRAWFDLSRIQGPVDDVRLLCQEVGVRRLVFGTNLPLHVAESPIMSLADAHLDAPDDAAIRYANARQAFGLPA
jgi:predicted TIM-barrel fold metal-dependent hydrolase